MVNEGGRAPDRKPDRPLIVLPRFWEGVGCNIAIEPRPWRLPGDWKATTDGPLWIVGMGGRIDRLPCLVWSWNQ